MTRKPITVTRFDFMSALAALINDTDLPAFAKLEVVERMKSQLEQLAQAEYERDLAAYRAALAKEKAEESKVLEADKPD